MAHNKSLLQQRTHKSTSSKFSRGKGSSKEDQDDDDYEDDGMDSTGIDPSMMVDVDGKDTKIVKAKLNSMRLDSLLKAGLGIAKNKVETAFYESRIRVNGEKILKKSKRMDLGDEIDVIKGANATNPSFLDVSRVLILAVDSSPDLEKFYVILKRYKALTIDNYPTAPYKRSINEDE